MRVGVTLAVYRELASRCRYAWALLSGASPGCRVCARLSRELVRRSPPWGFFAGVGLLGGSRGSLVDRGVGLFPMVVLSGTVGADGMDSGPYS